MIEDRKAAMTRADEKARRVLVAAQRQGVHVDAVRGVLLLSGRAPAYVREAWRAPLARHKDAIIRLLGTAPSGDAAPEQATLPGVRR